MEFEHAGGFTPMPGLRSPHWLPSKKTVLVASGNLMTPEGTPRDLDGLCAAVKEPTVDGALAHLFAELEADEQRSRQASPFYDLLDLGRGGTFPQLLAVDGGAFRVGRFRSGETKWLAPGGFLAIGAWLEHFLEPLGLLQRPTPTTLDGCLKRATAWARGYILSVYGGSSLSEMVRDGLTPTVGFPLHAVLFHRSDGLRQYRITEEAEVMMPAEVR